MAEPSRLLVALAGSLRAGSSNAALLAEAAAAAPGEVRVLLHQSLSELPAFNPDLDAEGQPAPPAVAAFRRQLAAAAGLLVCCPEYAHGIPGFFKNALDWLVSSGELTGKPVLMLHAGPGDGQFLRPQLAEVLRTLGATVLGETDPAVAFVRRQLSTEAAGGGGLTPEQRAALALRLQPLLALVA